MEGTSSEIHSLGEDDHFRPDHVYHNKHHKHKLPFTDGKMKSFIEMTFPIDMALRDVKKVIQQKICVPLSRFDFWLQLNEELDPGYTLADLCVEETGSVQVQFELIVDKDVGKINIVDIMKPLDEAENAHSFPENKNTASSSPATVFSFVRNWSRDPLMSSQMKEQGIESDPRNWSPKDTHKWIQCASKRFLWCPDGVNADDWTISGKELCEMSFENFLGKLDTPDLKSWRLVPSISQPTSSATTTSNSDKEDDTQPEEVQNPQFVGPVDSRVSQPEMNRLIPEMSSQAPISKELANRLIAKVHSSAYGDSYSGSCTTGQLWQFLLDLLTDYEMLPAIRWHRGGIDGEFVFLDHELVARLWGARKNKSGMNYEKLSRALRYYYDGDVIKKVHGADGKFVYKFVCDLKRIIGYHPCELNSKVWEQAALMRYEPVGFGIDFKSKDTKRKNPRSEGPGAKRFMTGFTRVPR